MDGSAHLGGPGAERLRFLDGEVLRLSDLSLSAAERGLDGAAEDRDRRLPPLLPGGGPETAPGGLGGSGGRCGACGCSESSSARVGRRRVCTGLKTSRTLARMASHCAASFVEPSDGG
mmetsp:Transcript_66049/g.121883  ORF Transcript_66049/g.121883 Transcript_66049/m.121883 type:complete len:118 (-) Transcript_66049:1724-2077(-)